MTFAYYSYINYHLYIIHILLLSVQMFCEFYWVYQLFPIHLLNGRYFYDQYHLKVCNGHIYIFSELHLYVLTSKQYTDLKIYWFRHFNRKLIAGRKYIVHISTFIDKSSVETSATCLVLRKNKEKLILVQQVLTSWNVVKKKFIWIKLFCCKLCHLSLINIIQISLNCRRVIFK